MKSIYNDIMEEMKSLPADKKENFLNNVAKLLAVRPYRVSEAQHAPEAGRKLTGYTEKANS